MTLFPTPPTLTGERVLLRPFTAPDIDAMGPILADPEVLRLTGSVHREADAVGRSPVLDAETRRWYETRADLQDRLVLAIVDRATDRCVGEVVLNEWVEADDSCNFRILVGPAGRGRGLGSEATRLVLDHAFATTGLHRISLEVHAANARARHVYRAAGFIDEGRRREAFVYDGVRSHVLLMAVLRTDPRPALRR